jgi:L-threonylcarbamoyladenylate synthase
LTRIIRIDPNNISSQAMISAVEILGSGGVVAYPTETFYGLGVNALNEEAVKKIYVIKKRDFSQPLLILIPHRDLLPLYVKDVPEDALMLIERFWPGPLTLIFSASSHLPSMLLGEADKIAIRVSSHPIAQALTKGLNSPITSTSANISGAQSPCTSEEVFSQLGNKIDLLMDGGRTPGEKPSTIIDVTVSPPRLIREGAIPFATNNKDEIVWKNY